MLSNIVRQSVKEKEVESERGKNKGMVTGKEVVSTQVEVKTNRETMAVMSSLTFFLFFFQ